MTLAGDYAAFTSRLAWRDLPGGVRGIALELFADWFANAVAGYASPLAQALRDLAPAAGRAVRLGDLRPAESLAAALINAGAAHALEFDDSYRAGLYHPGAPVIGAAFPAPAWPAPRAPTCSAASSPATNCRCASRWRSIRRTTASGIPPGPSARSAPPPPRRASSDSRRNGRSTRSASRERRPPASGRCCPTRRRPRTCTRPRPRMPACWPPCWRSAASPVRRRSSKGNRGFSPPPCRRRSTWSTAGTASARTG